MRRRFVALAGALIMAGLAGAAPQAQSQAPAAPQGQAQGQPGPKPKSPAEAQALMKVQSAIQANDAKGALDAITNVLENFADTEYKDALLNMAVQLAQQSGDYSQTVVWGQRALQAMPNDIAARVMLAESMASNTHPTDLDKDKSVKQIQDYANQALDLLKTATPAQAGIPEAKWPEVKQQWTSQAHDALGQADAIDKKYEDAIKEYQAALEADPNDPLILARMTKTYNDMKQYDQTIATADKALAVKPCPSTDSSPCLDPRVKAYVTAQKNVATRLKGVAAPAPTAPVPGNK